MIINKFGDLINNRYLYNNYYANNTHISQLKVSKNCIIKLNKRIIIQNYKINHFAFCIFIEDTCEILNDGLYVDDNYIENCIDDIINHKICYDDNTGFDFIYNKDWDNFRGYSKKLEDMLKYYRIELVIDSETYWTSSEFEGLSYSEWIIKRLIE